MPVPLLCNAPYPDELERLAFYQGFGGDYAASPDDPFVPRFVKAARRMAELERELLAPEAAVAAGLELLRTLWGGAPSQWSVLCDLRNGTVRFASDVAPALKWFSPPPEWFAVGQPVRWLDLHHQEGGDVAALFDALTVEANRAHHQRTLARWWPPGQTPEDWVDLNLLVDRFAAASFAAEPGPLAPFPGEWQGEATLPGGEPLPERDRWRLRLALVDGVLEGRVLVGDGATELEPARNLAFTGSTLSFTVRPAAPPAEGYPPRYPLVAVELRLDGEAMVGELRVQRNAVGRPGQVRLGRAAAAGPM
jgi:hypothetical protein